MAFRVCPVSERISPQSHKHSDMNTHSQSQYMLTRPRANEPVTPRRSKVKRNSLHFFLSLIIPCSRIYFSFITLCFNAPSLNTFYLPVVTLWAYLNSHSVPKWLFICICSLCMPVYFIITWPQIIHHKQLTKVVVQSSQLVLKEPNGRLEVNEEFDEEDVESDLQVSLSQASLDISAFCFSSQQVRLDGLSL